MTDETTTNASDPQPEPGIEDELRNLGRRFADVLHAAWRSEERRKVETEMRDSMKRFSDEMERLFERTRESPTGERVRNKFGEARGRAAESEAARRTRETVAQALHRMSEELARLADRFTPAGEGAGDADTTAAKSPDERP